MDVFQIQLDEATATRREVLFWALNPVDERVGITGLAFAAADIQVSKPGAGEVNSAGAETEVGGGLYRYRFTAGEVDTLGLISVRIAKVGVRIYAVAVEVVNSLDAIKADTAAILIDTGNDGVVLSTATKEAIADAILNRNINQGGNGTRTVEEALAFLRNKWTLVGTTLTVYDVDDASVLWTGTVTKDAAADPITANDPA